MVTAVKETENSANSQTSISESAFPSPALSKDVAIVGAGMAGLSAATYLVLRGANHNIKIYDARGEAGGRIYTDRDPATDAGDLGYSSVGSIHYELLDLIKIWSAGLGTQLEDYLIGYKSEAAAAAEAPVSEAAQESSPSQAPDPTERKRYYDRDGRQLDADDVEKGREKLDEFIANEFKKYDFSKFDLHNLTPEQKALQERSVASWLATLKVEGVSADALAIFTAIADNDNGVHPKDQNLLSFLLMHNAGGRKYADGAESYKVKGGASTLVKLACDWLAKNGVQFEFNCPVHMETAGEPVLKFNDGHKESFDKVILATPPSVYDACNFNPDQQMGQASFWAIKVEREWAEKYKSFDTMTIGVGETWEGAKEGANFRTMILYGGGEQYRTHANGINWEHPEIMYPGIKEHVLSVKTINWPKEEYTKGFASFPKPGMIGLIAKDIEDGRGAYVEKTGEHENTEFPGYMNGGVLRSKNLVDELQFPKYAYQFRAFNPKN